MLRRLPLLFTLVAALATTAACEADPAFVPVDAGVEANNEVRPQPDVGFDPDTGTTPSVGTGPARFSVGVSGGTLSTANHRLKVGVGAPITSEPVKLRTENYGVEVGAGPVIPAAAQDAP